MSAIAHDDTDLSDKPWDRLESLLTKTPWQPGGPGPRRSICDRLSIIWGLSINQVARGA